MTNINTFQPSLPTRLWSSLIPHPMRSILEQITLFGMRSQPTPHRPTPHAHRVLFLHSLGGHPCDFSILIPTLAPLTPNLHLDTVPFPNIPDLQTLAHTLLDAIDDTTPLSLVCFGLSGLVARLALHTLPDPIPLRSFITLAAPLQPSTTTRSNVLSHTLDLPHEHPVWTTLHSSPTWLSSVPTYCFFSPNDLSISPPHSAIHPPLSPNHNVTSIPCTHCTHFSFLIYRDIAQTIASILNAHSQG